MIELRDVVKNFPGVRALRGVSLCVDRGETVSIIGENGAGKSTLMKVLAGIHAPDSGSVWLDGRETRFTSPAESLAAGIVLIHQELNLANNLSIAQNIFLGREPQQFGFIYETRMNRDAEIWLRRVGLDLPPTTLVHRLSIGQQQMVEIAKALSTNARLIIMDEPTSSLSGKESQSLFDLIARLRDQQVSVLYISHRLAEVAMLSDRVEVLRDGENAGSMQREEITHESMVRAMVGRDLNKLFPHVSHPCGEDRLVVQNLVVQGSHGATINFNVRGGEIVGLAGLVGAGRTELLECIMGLRPATSGTVIVDGQALRLNQPRASIAAGLALVPEDRRHHGLLTAMSVGDNLTLPSTRSRSKFGWIAAAADRRMANIQVDLLKIKTPRLGQPAAFLSGGNQQKVVFGKWLLCNPKVLLLDEPTRGVDIGAKQEIYALMEQLASNGAAVLFASSEMEEILGMSDRALVMHDRRIVGSLARSELTEQAVTNLAFGLVGESASALR